MNQPMIEQRKETGRRIGDMHAVDEFRMRYLEEAKAELVAALGEAIDWNWLDADAPEDLRKQFLALIEKYKS